MARLGRVGAHAAGPAERQQTLDMALLRIRQAQGATPEARIGLVAADRPPDVLAVIGWDGLVNRGESLLPLTPVLVLVGGPVWRG